MLLHVQRRASLLSPLLALVFGCAGGHTEQPHTVVVRPPAQVDQGPPAPHTEGTLTRLESAHSIPDLATWQRLAARPSTSAVARTEVVKFLLDTQNNRTLWLIDTEHWDIHFEFAVDRLGLQDGYQQHEDFNVREYRRPERRFEMGSLVHYVDSDIWALEMIAGDNLAGDRLIRLMSDLRAATFFGDRLRYRPMSPLHVQILSTIEGQLPTVGADEVFRGVHYQPLTNGVTYGTLRLVHGPLDPTTVRPDQILVLEDLPDEVSVVSGIISSELQAPLGHIAILCSTRGTPNMGLRDALSNPDLQRLDGQLVRLAISPQEWSVAPATRAEAEQNWRERRPAQALTPEIDTHETRLRQVCDVRLADVRTVGAKAAQLGEVCGIGSSIRTPGGFTIPFRYYIDHLSRDGIQGELNAALADTAAQSDAHLRDTQLAAIRAHIQSTPVDPSLLRQVRTRMNEVGRGRRFIFRSSTNAEDLPGFTGAGLYRSIVVPIDATDEQVSNAIREVWASVWLHGAFDERDWYRVDQSRVAMAVLVQPFVDGALANGVAITANPFFEGRPGFFVNAQALGGSVTGAQGDEVPEQHLIYVYSETVESELLSSSSRSPDQLLLGEAEILRLTSALRRVHCHFRARWQSRGMQLDGSDALDIEYLIAGEDHHVVILQARPFEVRYEHSQQVAGLDLCSYHPAGVE